MDLENERPNNPVNIDGLTRLENADSQLRLPVDSLDGLTLSVASNVKYQYDYRATMKQRSSREERQHRSLEDGNPPPDASLSEHDEKAMAFMPTKNSKSRNEITASLAKRDLTMSDHNTNFCKPCRRIFDGNGSLVLPMTKQQDGLYYSHWDAQMLKRSARSCPLCLLVSRAIGTPITTNDLIPLRYDIVEFFKAEHVYGVRFWYYVMISTYGEVIVLYVPAKPMITIEAAESE